MCSDFFVAAAALNPDNAVAQAPASAQADEPPDPIRRIVDRSIWKKYKATIKGLTQFGDRRQGTDRNRAAVDWIEAQLKSYGCTNTERIKYDYQPPPPTPRPRGRARGADRDGERWQRHARQPASADRRQHRSGEAARREAPRAQRAADDARPARGGLLHEGRHDAIRTRCTSSARHMDGHGWGEAANDDGSGTALVMELARVFSSPDVQTERSIRFALWNNEETGLNGARAYVEQRQALQGKENPPGSGKYPEPKWLGMIQHDMMMFDHGMPRADGTMQPGAAPRGRRQHRVPGDLEDGRRRRRSWRGASRRPTRSTPPTIRPRSGRT